MENHLLRRAGAELIGTFALVTAGCGAIIVNAETGALGHSGIALTFGLVIAVMVAALGHLSGAHFNPAVSVAFVLARHFPLRELPAYLIGQVGGATLGAGALWLLFGEVAALGATVPTGTALQSFWLEILLTAALMFVIMAVATDAGAAGNLAALAIGGTVALGALWGGPISGASMNPARSFGPALMAAEWASHWVYWLGPVVGAALGALAYTLVREPAAAARLDDGPVEGRTVPAE